MHIYALMGIHVWGTLMIPFSLVSIFTHVNDVYLILFTKLGFTVHLVKSVLQPQQKIDFLGFVLDSITMMVTLNES